MLNILKKINISDFIVNKNQGIKSGYPPKDMNVKKRAYVPCLILLIPWIIGPNNQNLAGVGLFFDLFGAMILYIGSEISIRSYGGEDLSGLSKSKEKEIINDYALSFLIIGFAYQILGLCIGGIIDFLTPWWYKLTGF